MQLPEKIDENLKNHAFTIQHLWRDRLFSFAYSQMREQFFDISACSKENMRNLYLELRHKTLLPAAERAKYPKQNLYLPEEWQIRETWFKDLVPQMTVKHAAERITFKNLTPIAMRERADEAVPVQHTGKNAYTEFSFFVLGIGEEHRTPSFLGCNVETIIAAIGKLSPEQQKHFRGFWIGNEFSAEREATVEFGDTKRTVTFDREKRTKTYTYERKDGTKIIRTLHEKDEIFAADRNLNTIWDALLELLILELRCIGGSFQKYAYAHAKDPRILAYLFNCFFHSWVFPEGKKPGDFPLDQAFIKIHRNPPEFHAKAGQWFAAAHKGDSTVLQQFIKAGWPLDMTNEDHDTALTLVTKEGHTEAAILLLTSGADMGIRDILNYQPFHNAVHKDNRKLVEFMLQGIVDPIIPIIKRFPGVNKKYDRDHSALQLSLENKKNADLFWLLLENGAVITPDLPVISWMFTHGFKDALKELLMRGANVCATNLEGHFALMEAACKGDDEFIKALIAAGADVNQKVCSFRNYISKNEGQTALFFAAYHGHTDAMAALLAANADPNITDFYGRTVYQYISQILAAGLKGYLQKHRSELSAELLAHAQYGAKSVQIASEFRLKLYQDKWQTLSDNLSKAKLFLEQRNIIHPVQEKPGLIFYNHHIVSGVAIITGIINGKPHVLMVQQKTALGNKTTGDFKFPGGLREKYDATIQATALREAEEETGIKIPKNMIGEPVYTYQHVDLNYSEPTLVETHFVHLDLGDKLPSYPVYAKSEVARAFYLDLTQVVFNENSNGYYYNGARIDQSNYLLVNALLSHQTFPQHDIALCLATQNMNNEEIKNAIISRNISQLTVWHRRGINFNNTFALAIAVANDLTDIVDLLIRFGADVNHVLINFDYPTVLILAIAMQRDALVKHLVEKCGADVNIYVSGLSALTVACAHNRGMVNYLFAQGAKVQHKVGGAALLALMSGCRTLKTGEKAEVLTIAKQLLQTKTIDLNCQFKPSKILFSLPTDTYPLWFAVQLAIDEKCPVEFVQLLLNHGADPMVHRGTQSVFKYVEYRKNNYETSKSYLAYLVEQENRKEKRRAERAAQGLPEEKDIEEMFGFSAERQMIACKERMGNIDVINQIEQWLIAARPMQTISSDSVDSADTEVQRKQLSL